MSHPHLAQPSKKNHIIYSVWQSIVQVVYSPNTSLAQNAIAVAEYRGSSWFIKSITVILAMAWSQRITWASKVTATKTLSGHMMVLAEHPMPAMSSCWHLCRAPKLPLKSLEPPAPNLKIGQKCWEHIGPNTGFQLVIFFFKTADEDGCWNISWCPC